MNSVYENDVLQLKDKRQLQNVQHPATGAFAVGLQSMWTRYETKPFQDQRCPVCGAFGCDGC